MKQMHNINCERAWIEMSDVIDKVVIYVRDGTVVNWKRNTHESWAWMDTRWHTNSICGESGRHVNRNAINHICAERWANTPYTYSLLSAKKIVNRRKFLIMPSHSLSSHSVHGYWWCIVRRGRQSAIKSNAKWDALIDHSAHTSTNLSSLCNAMALAVRHSHVSESIIAAINLFQCFAIWLIYSVSGADVCAWVCKLLCTFCHLGGHFAMPQNRFMCVQLYLLLVCHYLVGLSVCPATFEQIDHN